MIALKGTSDSTFHLVASQIVIGLGGALTIALIQSAVQVSVPHAFVAQSIAALNIFPCMGNAIGAAVAGALWGNLLPSNLIRSLAATGHQSDVGTIYAEPLTWIESYPIGTTARTAVVEAYSVVWRIMMISATIVCATSVFSTMRMKNLKLNDFLSVVEETGKVSDSGSGCSNSGGGGVVGGGGGGSSGGSKQEGGSIKEGKVRLFGDRLFESIEQAFWKTCSRCGIKVADTRKQGNTWDHPRSISEKERDQEDDRVVDLNQTSSLVSRPSKSHLGGASSSSSTSNHGKSRAEQSSSVTYLPTIPPILIVDEDANEEAPTSLPVPSAHFRPQVSSPLARRFDDESPV
jgi:hypothetical protein